MIMAWKKYNPNPEKNRVGDCTVRALCCVLMKEWDEVYLGLCLEGFIRKDMPSANNMWGTYLWDRGFRRHFVTDECPACYTVKDFCEAFPVGRYLLALGSHVIAVIDGDYYDTWDSGDECPIYYWSRDFKED